MSLDRIAETRSIEVHQGAPLERVSASGLVLAQYLGEPRYYLASDVAVGNYGVIGFVLADSRPEKRWHSYTNGEWIGVEYSEDDILFSDLIHDPLSRNHFLDTDQGFRMIRHFVMPLNIRDFFEKDRFLGDPLVDKCCREGTLPEDFDEVPGRPNYIYWEGRTDGNPEGLLSKIIRYANPALEYSEDPGILWQDLGHRTYLSFHPWQAYKPVIEEGQESIFRAIANFDGVLSRFDRNGVLQTRGLEAAGIITSQPTFPQPERPQLS